MDRESRERLTRLICARDLLDQAVRYLALGPQPLAERLERCAVPLAAMSRADLETEAELALYARVQLGLAQLRRARAADPPDDAVGEDPPVFALQATASHVVELRDVTARRALRSLRAVARERRR